MKQRAYLSQPRTEWQSIVTRKAPNLPAGRGDLTYNRGDEGDDDDGDHDICTSMAIGDVIEKLDERVTSAAVEKRGGVRDGEAERQDCDIAEDCV